MTLLPSQPQPPDPDPDVELAKRLTRASIALNNDCCGNDAWRGLLCPYHDGFLDGCLAVLAPPLPPV